jgi:hypothetical protein
MIPIIIFLILYKLNAQIKEPSLPKEPSITNFKITNKEVKNEKKESEPVSVNLYSYNVSITFANKKILSGIVSFPTDEIKVTHTKEGFLFRKILKWSEIKILTILEWKPFSQSSETNIKTNILTYYFYPYKFKIISKLGDEYDYEGRIPYLDKLILTNEYGSTDIYSFFVDYWIVKGKNIGFWQNAKISNFYYPFRNPNKKVFKIINFK